MTTGASVPIIACKPIKSHKCTQSHRGAHGGNYVREVGLKGNDIAPLWGGLGECAHVRWGSTILYFTWHKPSIISYF